MAEKYSHVQELVYLHIPFKTIIYVCVCAYIYGHIVIDAFICISEALGLLYH